MRETRCHNCEQPTEEPTWLLPFGDAEPSDASIQTYLTRATAETPNAIAVCPECLELLRRPDGS